MTLQERLRRTESMRAHGHDEAADTCELAAAELDRLQARVAELEVDAERLDWLEQNRRPVYTEHTEMRSPSTDGSGAFHKSLYFDGWSCSPTGGDCHPTIRAALDTARKAKP